MCIRDSANRAIACREGTPEDLLKAMRLYQAVKIICEKKKLDAVTPVSYTHLVWLCPDIPTWAQDGIWLIGKRCTTSRRDLPPT